MTHSKPTAGTKFTVVPALIVGAILVIAWVLWRHREPERMAGSAPGYTVLSHGMLYRTDYREPGLNFGPSIRCRPVQGKERILIEEDARYAFATWPTTIAVSDGVVFYGLNRYRKPVYGGGPAGGSGSMPRDLGTFTRSARAGASPATPTAKRITMPPLNGNPDTILFRKVTAAGGPARDLATIHSSTAVLVGSHVFWNRPGPETQVELSRGNDRWTEISGKSDLILTDLMNGSEHQIGSYIQRYTNWIVGRDGVFWTAPRPFPDRTTDLFYARALDGAALKLGELQEGQTVGWSVEFQGSLYWFVRTETHDDVLMAANLNGTNVRTVLQLNPLQSDAQFGENLSAYHGALYCLVKGASIPSPRGQPVQLARIRPGKSNPLEILRILPMDTNLIGFDDGFLYYYVTEVQRGLWATITDDDAGETRSNAIYRVRLE